ncbi:carboxylesterase family protein [Pseudonocardia petroleophila]|uniref:Carboxylic ester hydrolase n=1 Tax=Pseudonocardia petroleophila TaxID=37331 RepID=A0A7G7MIT6_9PSEU|nr:carboxylesterase family protein [Pseudonocardia petroleophila]QNG52697.1 carboxylesterase family protein [Pseudonocardia petroleophila]
MSTSTSAVRGRLGLPLAVLALASVVLLYLNRSAAWGWVAVGLLLAGTALVVLRLRRPALRLIAWGVCTVLLAVTALGSHPDPEHRPAAGEGATPGGVVRTTYGPVSGLRTADGAVEVFAGVPYARPPVDDLRWRPPVPPQPWTEVREATEFADVPVQPSSSFALRAVQQTVDVPLAEVFVNPYPTGEDSLYLNVWRPTRPESAALPVIVTVPGGGFATGSGELPVLDGEPLARRGDVVTVTVNYRLGVFGFLAHPELDAESRYASSGNYGLLDQVAALRWVRDNIAAFGGDPQRITVAGESAGGESVCLLSTMPATEGLFHRVIGGSGGCLGTAGDTAAGDQVDTREVARRAGQELSSRLGGASVAELRAMPAERVFAASRELAGHWRPSIDGHALRRAAAEVIAAGEQHDVPILVGSNADEASLARAAPPDTDPAVYRADVERRFGTDAEEYLRLYPGGSDAEVLDSILRADADRVVHRAMHLWAREHTSTGTADAYVYFFTRVPPDPALQEFGAYHGAELMYAYGTLGAAGDADYTAADLRLSARMTDHWVRFAATGDPNGPGLPRWPSVAESPDQVMGLGERSGMRPRPRADAVDFWLRHAGPIA